VLNKVLTLSPDYAADLPLWGDAAVIDGLPWVLLDRLAGWQEFFDQHYLPLESPKWSSLEDREWWQTEAQLLAEDLRYALPGDIELKVDLWPLEDEEDRDREF
jgi:hypothetical protein